MNNERNYPKTKVCRNCKEEKPASEFHRSGRTFDGLLNECKICRNMRLEREHLLMPGSVNPEKYSAIEEGVKEYYSSNNGLGEKLVALNKENNILVHKLKSFKKENEDLKRKLKLIEHKQIVSSLEEDEKKRRELLKELL